MFNLCTPDGQLQFPVQKRVWETEEKAALSTACMDGEGRDSSSPSIAGYIFYFREHNITKMKWYMRSLHDMLQCQGNNVSRREMLNTIKAQYRCIQFRCSTKKFLIATIFIGNL
jgi:hypothetical protein